MDRLMTFAAGETASMPTGGIVVPFYGSAAVVTYIALNRGIMSFI